MASGPASSVWASAASMTPAESLAGGSLELPGRQAVVNILITGCPATADPTTLSRNESGQDTRSAPTGGDNCTAARRAARRAPACGHHRFRQLVRAGPEQPRHPHGLASG